MTNLDKMETLLKMLKGAWHSSGLKLMCTPDFMDDMQAEIDALSEDEHTDNEHPGMLARLGGHPLIISRYLPPDCDPCAMDFATNQIWKLAESERDETT